MPSQTPAEPTPNRYSVWTIVLAAAAIAGIAMGIRTVMGLYMKPMTEALGFTRSDFSLAIGIANITWGLAAPFTGVWADTQGAARVVAAGVVATVGGLLVMWGAATSVHLFLSGILLGLGIAGAGINTMVGAVGRAANDANRSAAIATVGLGSGVGILLALPYAHVMIEAVGWQTSLLVLAATGFAMIALIPVIAGAPVARDDASMPQSWEDALRQAARSPSFWLLNAGFFVCGFHIVFYGTHLPAYVADQGLAPEVAVWALVMVGVGNLIGTYLAGQWGRFLPKRYGLALIYVGRSVVFLGFLYLPITPLVIIALSAALGLLWLATVPLTSSLVATFFGARWMTMLYGIVFLSHQLGSFLGVWMAGVVFDELQSYDLMWWISVALGVAAAAVHWPIREERAAALPATVS